MNVLLLQSYINIAIQFQRMLEEKWFNRSNHEMEESRNTYINALTRVHNSELSETHVAFKQPYILAAADKSMHFYLLCAYQYTHMMHDKYYNTQQT